MRSWLVLLLLLALFGSGQTCETVVLQISKNESCYSHALFLNPSSFAQYPNGTCVFLRVCGKKSRLADKVSSESLTQSSVQVDKMQGKFLIKTKRVEKYTTQWSLKWRCPSFEKISTIYQVLLMRTHASRKVSPYALFRNTSASSELHMTKKEADADRTVNFRSPLLASDRHETLKRMYVELFDSVGRAMVQLSFRINPGESIQKGRWFAKDRLYATFPYYTRKMKNTKFNHFSIDGLKDARTTRRFYINARSGDCASEHGFMSVVDQPYCPWERKRRFSPSYIWTMKSNSYGHYSSRIYEAVEFRITGIFATSPDYYVRKRQNC